MLRPVSGQVKEKETAARRAAADGLAWLQRRGDEVPVVREGRLRRTFVAAGGVRAGAGVCGLGELHVVRAEVDVGQRAVDVQLLVRCARSGDVGLDGREFDVRKRAVDIQLLVGLADFKRGSGEGYCTEAKGGDEAFHGVSFQVGLVDNHYASTIAAAVHRSMAGRA